MGGFTKRGGVVVDGGGGGGRLRTCMARAGDAA